MKSTTTAGFTAPEPLPRLLTCREVAVILRCSESQVYSLAADGSLPCIRIGRGGKRRLVRFYLSDVMAALGRVAS